jgi:hypothetical protein
VCASWSAPRRLGATYLRRFGSIRARVLRARFSVPDYLIDAAFVRGVYGCVRGSGVGRKTDNWALRQLGALCRRGYPLNGRREGIAVPEHSDPKGRMPDGRLKGIDHPPRTPRIRPHTALPTTALASIATKAACRRFRATVRHVRGSVGRRGRAKSRGHRTKESPGDNRSASAAGSTRRWN